MHVCVYLPVGMLVLVCVTCDVVYLPVGVMCFTDDVVWIMFVCDCVCYPGGPVVLCCQGCYFSFVWDKREQDVVVSCLFI